MNNRKIITIGLISGVIIIIGIIIYVLIPRATLLFSVAPHDMTLIINGQKITIINGQKITVSPGKLSFTLSRSEFKDYNGEVSIKNGETQEILYTLTPLTDAAKQLLASDESQQIIQRITNKDMQSGAADLMKKYPILNILPINEKYYTILPCNSVKYPNDKTKIAICVKYYDTAAQQPALDYLTSLGYKPSDYEIIFEDNTYTTLNSGD